jgi:hypothetical protein
MTFKPEKFLRLKTGARCQWLMPETLELWFEASQRQIVHKPQSQKKKKNNTKQNWCSG